MRKTKIVCTIGPASRDRKVMEGLFMAGMDVARLNMSHENHAAHGKVIKDLRATAKRLGKQIAILMDLCGPKIRVGRMQNGGIELKEGALVTLTTHAMEGTPQRFSTSYKKLAQDCGKGDPILLDDGKMRLRVESVRGTEVTARVEVGGLLKNSKGMNLPGVALSTPSVTKKDMEDLRFGLAKGVDFVALSFVRHPDDVIKVKKAIAKAGKKTPIIAKIEKPEALEHLRAIAREADGIMVARGDLGVELDLEKVPLIQKEVIALANANKALVITATQMLESMTEASSPTRAEVSDVANAILDGTDAVMLSGETAAGKFPVEACATMARICQTTESSAAYRQVSAERLLNRPSGRRSVAEAVSYAARGVTEDLRIRAIVCFTKRGRTARYISKSRPEIPIYAYTPSPTVLPQLNLYWGTEGGLVKQARSTESLIRRTAERLKKEKKVFKGDIIAVVAGTPIDLMGGVNMIKIHEVE